MIVAYVKLVTSRMQHGCEHVCMNSFSNAISAIWGCLIHTFSTAQALKVEGIMGQGLLVYV